MHALLLAVVIVCGIHFSSGSNYYRPYRYGHSYYYRKPVKCERLDAPGNGTVDQTGTSVGSRATYSCNVGFVLTGGQKVRVCQRDGTFSGNAPTCQIVDCGDPDEISNGEVFFSTTTFQSTALYICEIGFNLVGSKTLVCQANGKYSDDAPSCVPVDCGQPDPPNPNSRLEVGSTTLGSQAQYRCDEGFFVLRGPSIIVCESDGEWSAGAILCARVDCGEPDVPENGNAFFESTTFQSKVVYSCNPNFRLVGSRTAECQSNREYSSPAPLCIQLTTFVDCGSLSNPSNGKVVTSPGTTQNSIAIYTCRKGFRLAGNRQRICQANGQWSGSEPKCRRQRRRCPRLPRPRFGSLVYSGYNPGSYVTYRCDYGYGWVGRRYRRTCLSSGVWSGSRIFCRKRSIKQIYG